MYGARHYKLRNIHHSAVRQNGDKEEFRLANQWFKPKRHWKEIELWKDVPEEKWNDWVWQLTHTVRTLDELKKSFI